jgi:hypothetical protein
MGTEVLKMDKRTLSLVALALLGGAVVGCRPRSAAEKVEDKVEDAAHEAGQAIERTGERVKDAAD